MTCPAPKTVRLRSKALLRIVTARLPIQAALSKSVKVEQSLEKFAFLWFWNTEGGPWTRTVNSGVAQFDNYKVVSSGTYRVKSVFTVTTKDGKSETITMYSNEVKVA